MSKAFLSIAITMQRGAASSALSIIDNAEFYMARNDIVDVQLRKRDAYPGTYLHVDNTIVQFGYGFADKQADVEFLHCMVTQAGMLTIERDSYGTLPLYYFQKNGVFRISNEYGNLASELKDTGTLHKPSYINALVAGRIPPPPLLEEIKILWPNQTLTYNGQTVSIAEKPQTWKTYADLPESDPYSFRETFSTHLDNFISSRLHNQRYAFELSGGLDSATLPQYMAHTYNEQPTYVSMIMHDDNFQRTQIPKLQRIHTTTNGNLIPVYLNPKELFPLSHHIKTGLFEPAYQSSLYVEPMRVLLETLRAEGVSVICTGIGGDEIFSHDPMRFSAEDKKEQAKQPPHIAPYLTPAFRALYQKNQLGYPEPKHRPASIDYVALHNNEYIRRDIWPVSPFSSEQFYQWAQGLPIQFRSNKNILRAYHQAHNFVPEVYNAAQNEHFSRFFDDCFAHNVYDDIFSKLVEKSQTIQAGYVDKAALIETYTHNKAHQNPHRNGNLFAIYLWMKAELDALYFNQQFISY